jgi:hypothetical protein
MHRKEMAEFQIVIISFIKKRFNRKWDKDSVLKRIEEEEKKVGGGWTKKNVNKFRSLSFEQ